MKVVQIKCPKCQNPFYSRFTDMVFLCEHCGALHVREPELKILDYEFWEFGRAGQGDKYYMPFWRLYTTVTIHHMQVAGGVLVKLANLLAGGGSSGNIFIYVPAIELSPEEFKYWSNLLTFTTPRANIALKIDKSIPRLPVKISETEAIKLADFLVLTYEAEKPGVLQDISYDLRVNNTKLIYFPVFYSQNRYEPGV
ncbi:MAG: hypothetical protein QW531_01870 [Thermoplasmata archaeon]